MLASLDTLLLHKAAAVLAWVLAWFCWPSWRVVGCGSHAVPPAGAVIPYPTSEVPTRYISLNLSTWAGGPL